MRPTVVLLVALLLVVPVRASRAQQVPDTAYHPAIAAPALAACDLLVIANAQWPDVPWTA